MEFTHRRLEALKPEPKTREEFATGTAEKAHGLAIRVAPTGLKVFTFHFTHAGKRARMDLGRFPAFGLDDARNAVRLAREALEADRDPRDARAEERTAAAGAMTLSALAALYLADPGVKSLKSWKPISDALNSQFLQFIGDKPIETLTRRDFAECIDRIRKRGSMTYAAQCHKHARLLYAWAIGAGHVDTNPILSIPKPAVPEERGEKCRPLDDEGELKAFWYGIKDALPAFCAGPYSRILKLALLTGARLSEVAEIQPGEIRDGVWIIDGKRTKNKKPHAIPLNSTMLELLGNDLNNPWGTINGRPANGDRVSDRFSDCDISRKLGSTKGYTVHSLRRTFATGLDELGIPEATIGLCLNHSPKREERPDEGAAVTKRYIFASDNNKARKAAARLALKRQTFDLWTKTVLEWVGN